MSVLQATVPLDSVIPRPWPTWRVIVVTVALLAAGAGVWFVRWDGGFTPQLRFGQGFGESGVQHGLPFLEGDLKDTSWFPVTVRAVDATAPGLTDPRVVVSAADGRRLRLPVRLHEGESVVVRITWRHLDCSLVRVHERYEMPVSYQNFLGLPGRVGVVPFWWIPPNAASSATSSSTSQRGVGWPTGVSWYACGRPPTAAPTAQPADT